MKQKIAVIGAWSVMGRAILNCLATKGFPAENIYALDGYQKAGALIPFGSGAIETDRLDMFNFRQIEISFLCTPSILMEDMEKILNYGRYLIDCVGLICEGPCIVAGLNMKICRKERFILNPTGLSIILAHLFQPIQNRHPIKSALITALLPACEFGEEAVSTLADQTRSLYTHEAINAGPFQKTQAFNLLPEIEPILARQTMKQVKKLFQIPVQIMTCLTPAFQGECLSLFLTTKEKSMCSDIKNAFCKSKKCRLVNEFSPYLTVGSLDVLGHDEIYIIHLKSVPAQSNTYQMWVVCDNVQTGAALNAVQIAEHILS